MDKAKTIALFVIAAILVFASLRPRILPSSSEEDGRTVVNLWVFWNGIEADAMQSVVDDFNKSQLRIKVKMLSTDTDQKLLLAIAGGSVPDLAVTRQGAMASLAEKGGVIPLDRRLEEAGIGEKDYIPSLWRICRHKGFTWGLPLTPATLALHWNRRLFEEAGLDPDKPPTTLDELDAMAERLTIVELKRNGETVRARFSELSPDELQAKRFDIVQLGHSPLIPGWWACWELWFGGHRWNGKDALTAGCPENVETFEWIRSYPSKYGLENLRAFTASTGNSASTQDPFLSGRVAMVLQGVWLNNFIQKYSPGLDWAAAPFPAKRLLPGMPVTNAGTDIIIMPRGAAHPNEAFEFLKYMSSQGPIEKLCIAQSKFSPLSKTSPDFQARHPNKFISLFRALAESPNAGSMPDMPLQLEFNDEINAAAERVFSLKQSPKEALDAVDQRLERKFKSSLSRWESVKGARMEEWRNYESL